MLGYLEQPRRKVIVRLARAGYGEYAKPPMHTTPLPAGEGSGVGLFLKPL